MRVNVKEINGVWDKGYSLDKHTIRSVFVDIDENGRKIFDTERTDVGEALYQLKYKKDFSQCECIAENINNHIVHLLPSISFIVAMPPSKIRDKQPVTEIARILSSKMHKPFINGILVKSKSTPQMKDISTRNEKLELLLAAFCINESVVAEVLPDSNYNVLIIDDLFDTGTSLEAATQTLFKCDKISKVLVATATRKNE